MANLVGTKWGSSKLGTAGGTVTWSIAGAGTDVSRFGLGSGTSVSASSFLDYDYEALIESAFNEWSTYGDIEFKQVSDNGAAAGVGTKADIRLYFSEIPGGTAGYAFFPSSYGSAIAGDILLDTLDKFNTDPELFFNLLLHEIGHALGLEHTDELSIMRPNIKKIGLQEDDIDGIVAIYGAQQASDIPSSDTGSGSDGSDGSQPPAAGTAPDPDPEPAPAPEPEPAPEEPTDGNDAGNIAGSETLTGTSSADVLKGNKGNDTIYGQSGDDTLKGGADDDVLHGDNGYDKLVGNDGDDELYGGKGEDLLKGGNGDDLMNGGKHDDALYGGKGEDTLIGGKGDDLMRGDEQSDLFIFEDGHGHDVIIDFDATDIAEKIDLSDLTGFSKFKHVTQAAVQDGDDVLIDTSDASSILLRDVDLNTLDSSDFLF